MTEQEYTPFGKSQDDVSPMSPEEFKFHMLPPGDPMVEREFDRMIAERDRQVAERAWDEGRASALIRDEDNPNVITVSFGHKLNPYRKEATGD